MGKEIRYSYKHAPTLWKFHQSDAFVRGLMGPWRCLSGDTEFLTPHGWKRLDEFQAGDLVAQWDHRDGTTTFVPPIAYIKEPSVGFLRFKSSALIMEMTPNHRVPHYDYRKRFSVSDAAEIAAVPSRRWIPTTFTPNDRPGIDMNDDLIRFAVMMHADGYYPKHGLKAVITVRKERKKERIRETLGRLGIAWKEFTYPRRPTETIFSFVPPYRGKHFIGDWWKATPAQLAIVIDEMSYWDGNFLNKQTQFFTIHKQDADFIQYAAHAIGLRAALYVCRKAIGNRKTLYRVGIRNRGGKQNVAAISSGWIKVTNIPSPDGLQYCFTVPTGFFVARCRDTIFITGNSGKSSGCVVEIIQRAQQQAPSRDGIRRTRWMIVRNTQKDLRDTTIKTFMHWIPESHFGVFNKTTLSYKILGIPGCEIEVWFRALDNEDDIKHLLSLEVTGAWFNEAREIPWSLVKAMMGRVNQFPAKSDVPCTWGGIILDSNPPDSTSAWFKFFEEQQHAPSFAEIFKQPSGLSDEAENLAFINGGRSYYERLSQDADEEWIKVYIRGEYGFVQSGRSVYMEYSDTTHCKEVNPVAGLQVRRSYDFGLTPSCVFTQIMPDQRYLIFDEMTSDDMSVDAFTDQVLDHSLRSFQNFKKVEFVDTGDPAGVIRSEVDARSVFQMMRAKGIDIQPGLQSVALRIESVRKPLRKLLGDGKPQLVLHPRCVMLRKGFLGHYHYRKLHVSGDRFADTPEKNEASHPHDALQYDCSRLFASTLMLPNEGRGFGNDDDTYGSDADRNETTGY